MRISIIVLIVLLKAAYRESESKSVFSDHNADQVYRLHAGASCFLWGVFQKFGFQTLLRYLEWKQRE